MTSGCLMMEYLISVCTATLLGVRLTYHKAPNDCGHAISHEAYMTCSMFQIQRCFIYMISSPFNCNYLNEMLCTILDILNWYNAVCHFVSEEDHVVLYSCLAVLALLSGALVIGYILRYLLFPEGYICVFQQKSHIHIWEL